MPGAASNSRACFTSSKPSGEPVRSSTRAFATCPRFATRSPLCRTSCRRFVLSSSQCLLCGIRNYHGMAHSLSQHSRDVRHALVQHRTRLVSQLKHEPRCQSARLQVANATVVSAVCHSHSLRIPSRLLPLVPLSRNKCTDNPAPSRRWRTSAFRLARDCCLISHGDAIALRLRLAATFAA